MSLSGELDIYLAQRRGRGFQLKTTEYLLRQFCGWLEARGASGTFTIEDAVAWACEPAGCTPVWWSQRLIAVRPFVAWLNARDGVTPIIPAGLLPVRTTRRTPFIYSQTDLNRMLQACPFLFGNVRVAAMMVTFVGLMAATGLRIGEAIGLQVPDLDITENVLTVRATKTPRDRLVPLDPSTTNALLDFINLPERMATHPSPVGPIFVNHRGQKITIATIEQHFQLIVDALGMTPPGQRRPRPHDLRHTYATRHMIAAYTVQGGDPARTLTLLTTWLGHTAPEHTYWYLSAVPELLAAAAQRLEPASLQGEPTSLEGVPV